VAKTATKTNSKRRTSTKSMKKAGTTRKTKPGSSKRAASKSAASTGDQEVVIDRRRGGRRDDEPTPVVATSTAGPALERRQKVNRRRQIDPTTCERDYTEHEVEFMNALDDYKRKSGRMFPTCSEVLEVIRSLGYVKLSAAEMFAMPGAGGQNAASAKPMPSDWSSSGEMRHEDEEQDSTSEQTEIAF
jgi:hypothetical protein